MENAIEKVVSEQIVNDLNAKILKITLKIKDQYPELSQYLEEMPVTIPSEKNPEISHSQLEAYYESLVTLLEQYKGDKAKTEE